jgi:U3 small nucleolar RNA-associated protein 4
VYTSGPDQRVAQFTYVASASANDRDELDRPTSTVGASGEWQQTSIKRLHKHDVRTLAVFPGYSLAPRNSSPIVNPHVAPVLASGGLDMSIVLTSAGQTGGLAARRKGPLAIKSETNPITNKGKETFTDAVKVDLGYLPRGNGTDVIGVAREKRLVLVKRQRGVALFRVREMRSRGEEAEGEAVPGGWDKVLEMNFQVGLRRDCMLYREDG